MRPTWQGNLKLALVLVPVRAYPAARPKAVSMNQLHAECGARIRQTRRCPNCDREVERDEITKGYEFSKDQYVVLSDEDLKGLQLPSLRTLDIVQFVEESEINPLYYHGSYYLAPANEVAAGPFHTILEAMRVSGRVGVAQVVLTGKERVVAIRPGDGVFVMSFLHYADEVRAVSEIEQLPPAVKPNAAETAMAKQLLDSYAKPFETGAFEDSYRKRFLEIVEAKRRGEEVVAPPSVEPQRVVNLMDALKASLARIEADPAPPAESGPDAAPAESGEGADAKRLAG